METLKKKQEHFKIVGVTETTIMNNEGKVIFDASCLEHTGLEDAEYAMAITKLFASSASQSLEIERLTIQKNTLTKKCQRYKDERNLAIETAQDVKGVAELHQQEIERLRKENEELKSSINAGNRLRMMDASSAINEANGLREKIKDQELIIHGIEEGSGEWQSKFRDSEWEIERLREALRQISNSSEDTGRADCTYGDTEYDSLTVVYGYNLCLENLKEIADSALEPKK